MLKRLQKAIRNYGLKGTMVKGTKWFIANKLFPRKTTRYYSQYGEDAVLKSLFFKLGIDKVRYVDIGANDPKFLSNTYFFYKNMGGGVF